jgi:hypothetical protein
MKHGKNMDEVLKRGLRSASRASEKQMEAVGGRVLGRVLSKAASAETADTAERAVLDAVRAPGPLRQRLAMAAAAVMLLLTILAVGM